MKILYYLKTFALPPLKSRRTDAGIDLACTAQVVSMGTTFIVDSGVSILIPRGYYGLLMPRSSMTLESDYHLEPAVIDAEYTGTIKLVIKVFGARAGKTDKLADFVKTFSGEYIAQLVIHKLPDTSLVLVDAFPELSRDARGKCGFGSTNKGVKV